MAAFRLGTDRVEIDGLVVMTVVGALPHERDAAQPVRIDLSIGTDLHDAGRTDELDDTVNYGAVAEQVAGVVRAATDTLLERLADRIATTVLAHPRADSVAVTVTKLRPPIPEQVESTAVRIVRDRTHLTATSPEAHSVIVALGSNLGDRESYLRLAIERLGTVSAASQVFETAPVGGPEDQGAYLNMVVAVDTALDPYAYLRRCHRIEADAGRERTVHWGPRTLDVDILFYDHITIADERLTIPHPLLGERRFVLTPLAEVAPDRCPAGWDDRLASEEVIPRGPLAR